MSETKVKLKTETDVKHDSSSTDEIQADEAIPEQNFLNAGASTSSANTPQEDENKITHKAVYYHPVRERVKRVKNLLESSSSNDSSSSSDWQLQSSPKRGKKYSKSMKTRRKSSKTVTTKKNSPTSNIQKLAMLPSSEKTKDDETKCRIRRVIVKSSNN